ncbi:MAG TPA: hypothetical protein VI298_02985 [Geobacteraceae bacterium]
MRTILIMIWSCVLIAVSGRLSHADFNTATCFTGCFTEHKNCIAGINAVNDIEINDQTEACNSKKTECDDKCNAAVREETEQKEKQQREQSPQEPGGQPAQEE